MVGYLTLPYGKGELPPSAEASSGPMHVPKLTLRLLEPLGVSSKLEARAPTLPS